MPAKQTDKETEKTKKSKPQKTVKDKMHLMYFLGEDGKRIYTLKV